ncbi:MAG: xanthine dehydrogenase family protein subunit M, partial [Pseudolabrys sp.]
MSINVKTFASLADAAGALSSERGARFLGGGTLLMRAVNRADPDVETIVRSTDPSFLHLAVSSG